MKAIRTIAGEYDEKDIYNMDETGLFWRLSPSNDLSSAPGPGVKKNKARITVVLCANAAGTDRFKPWFIGHAKTPRAPRNVNMETMGGVWRFNKRAWMTTIIMGEWLQKFYEHIGTSRTVLLSLDNFSAHTAAVQALPPPSNIRICFLPANSTSRYQPLDQGIIANFKVHYRRHWLYYMLREWEEQRDPLSTVNLLLAVRWVVVAWTMNVSNTTIYNCFRKSTLLSCPIQLPAPLIPSDIQTLFRDVQTVGRIQDAMQLSNFLNPEDESIEDDPLGDSDPDTFLQNLLDDHLQQKEPSVEEEEGESEPVIRHMPSAQEALRCVQVFRDFLEGQDAQVRDILVHVHRGVEYTQTLLDSRKVQTTLDS